MEIWSTPGFLEIIELKLKAAMVSKLVMMVDLESCHSLTRTNAGYGLRETLFIVYLVSWRFIKPREEHDDHEINNMFIILGHREQHREGPPHVYDPCMHGHLKFSQSPPIQIPLPSNPNPKLNKFMPKTSGQAHQLPILHSHHLQLISNTISATLNSSLTPYVEPSVCPPSPYSTITPCTPYL